MENPFNDLKNQLSRIEGLLIQALENKQEQKVPYESKWMNVSEAAEYLQIAKPTLYALTCRREIPLYKRGKKIYFKKDELNEWLEKGKKKTYGNTN